MQKAPWLAVAVLFVTIVSYGQEAPRGGYRPVTRSCAVALLATGTSGEEALWQRPTQCLARSGQEHQPRSQSELVIHKGTSVTLFLTGELKGDEKNPRVVRLFSRMGAEKGKKGSPSIVVAEDIVVDGITVIERGTPVQYMIGGEAPGRMSAPGRVVVEIAGVTSTSLEFVPLLAGQSVRGKPPSCEDAACAALVLGLWWVHGDPGKINAGLLFNSYVTEDIKLKHDAASRSTVTAPSWSLSRLHLYQVIQVASGQSAGNELEDRVDDLTGRTFWSAFSLDGKHVGNLKGLQYACWKVSPGSHILRVEHHEYTFDVGLHQEVYVRVTSQGRDRLVETTDGYQIGGATLEPGLLKGGSSSPCFDLL